MDRFLALKAHTEAEMLRVGARIAQALQAGDCLALHGTLGAGKTTLTRGILRAIMGEGCDVPSPTFTLVQIYTPHKLLPMIWHFDLYRLKAPQDVVELGWDTALEDIALVEWPQKAGAYLPRWALEIEITYLEEGGREIRFTGKAWREARFSAVFE